MNDSVSTSSSTPELVSERRSNELLRSLVNEMLERVRELNRRATGWTPGERAQAESELEAIMQRVRREAGGAHDNG